MKRKVLIIYPGMRGGIRREIEYLLQAWRVQGDAPRYRAIDSRGGGNVRWSPLFLVRGLCIALKEILFGRVALMHVNLSIGASTVRKGCFIGLAALTGVPVVLHLHSGRYGYYFSELSPWKKRVVQAMFRRALRVVVLGDIWKEFVIESIGVDPSQLVVMYNAVPAPAQPPARPDSGPCRLLFLGWLSPDKGIPELLNALADPRVRRLDWTCVLAGADPRVPDGRIGEYRRRVQELGLSDRVSIPGWVDSDRVPQLLTDAEVTLLPSHHEGMPMTVLEGMAYGHAIVSTPVGVLPEIIEEEKSGFLVPVGDETALADALYRVISDRGLRSRLGCAAFQKFQADFDIMPYARRLMALYHDCGLALSSTADGFDVNNSKAIEPRANERD